ncbi:hypothetical protein KIW84_023321 [Lathyrus oleraceus]|uniref:Uncharacterized protein n=1 Tax=Pisum sativum TaxID=3888 RepID=A0A9D5BBP6_PEA|nr:hypothetical protein KIW84_023321 [Pisum sativum]
MEKLPSLKNLIVSNLSHVKYLYEESWNGGVAGGFTKLEKLVLEQLLNLLKLSREDRDNMFLCLSIFEITECPILLELPCLPSLSDLLVQAKCSQHLLSSIHKLGSLEKLSFKNYKEPSLFPVGMLRDLTCLKNLQSLSLGKLLNLASLPDWLGNLGLLHKLEISNCSKLTCLPMSIQHLTNMKTLEIYNCMGHASRSFANTIPLEYSAFFGKVVTNSISYCLAAEWKKRVNGSSLTIQVVSISITRSDLELVTRISLLDSGSTHNFLDLEMARKLGCKLEAITPLSITGGIQWLKSLGPILWDLDRLHMEFSVKGKKISLRGAKTPGVQLISNDALSMNCVFLAMDVPHPQLIIPSNLPFIEYCCS